MLEAEDYDTYDTSSLCTHHTEQGYWNMPAALAFALCRDDMRPIAVHSPTTIIKQPGLGKGYSANDLDA